ncbi:hypothetical protein Tsubulata_021861 [Turnera subulata]|uniref:DUF4283 domain-containing protein n=1 Tax=Turnera subulata TaxID=218843 RepID=A0A9Q0JCP6_9ROSI|nr:hypothetical protein Tsubulata_021861 [Turnera subulata]
MVTTGKSYFAAVKGLSVGDKTPAPNMAFIPTSDTMSWLSRCMVGVLKHPTDMESVIGVWALHGYTDVKVSDLGGDSVLVCFPSTTSMTQFTQANPEWVSLWFKMIRPWQRGDCAETRRCWLSIRGVPLHAWCLEFFMLIASEFGKMVSVNVVTEQKQRLDEARVEVLTTQGRRIDKELVISIAESQYVLNVVEVPSLVCWCATAHRGESVFSDQPDEDSSPENGEDGGRGTLADDSSKQTKFDEVDPIGLMPKSHLIQGVINMTASASTSNSKNLPLANSFGPLGDQDASEAQVPLESIGSPQSLGIKEPLGQPKAVTIGSHEQYMEELQNSTQNCNESDARYIEYLEDRLANAIHSRRVNRGRKFNKVRANGSVTSADSSVNSDIRRVNMRLSQQGPTPTQSVSFSEVEAQETMDVGNMLGRDNTGKHSHVITMARDLVEKEAFEWSKSQTDV